MKRSPAESVSRKPSKSHALDRDWEQATRKLAAWEPDFIFNQDFTVRGADAQILEALPAETTVSIKPWKPGKEMPAYLVRMCETPLLKPEEEVNLFRRMNYAKYRADTLRRKLDPDLPDRELILRIEGLQNIANADRERLVRANLRLVVSIAKKFADPRNPFDDLLSEGITSLLRAVEKFDYSRGFRFSTYATQAVRRTLCRHLSQLKRDRGRMLTAEGSTFEDCAEEDNHGTLTETRWEELRRVLAQMLNQLDPRERSIIRRRFGLDAESEVTTLQSLAGDLGVCKERVRQLEIRAIGKLREMADAISLSPPEES